MGFSLINNLNKYVRLTEDEAALVDSLFIRRSYRKNQFILNEGDIMRYENYIVKGLTRTFEVDEKGQEHILQFAVEDWWIGDLFSFLSEVPSQYNIVCMEDTELMQISKSNLEQLYVQVPKLERHFRILIQNAFVAMNKRVSSTLTKSAFERYTEFIGKYPQIEQRVTNHQIASYLGVTPQSLSRIRSQATKKI